MDVMITASAEMKKITSLDDDKLWAGFDWEETECYPQRGPLIAKELLSVFPNSRYMIIGIRSKLQEVIALAKRRRFTSLILTHTNSLGHDILIIISLLNGASAVFRVIDFIPHLNCANPPSRPRYPELHMKSFNSQASVGTARMIQALFPKVPSSGGRPVAWPSHMALVDADGENDTNDDFGGNENNEDFADDEFDVKASNLTILKFTLHLESDQGYYKEGHMPLK
ncbi:hypothetical protein ARALYDRAFT_344625 [Arabidopsis lyrata subsp. lyrata]|uniref:Uncharacterized protein n=1 Tax=Arabidopsis lyrata subsp. lyrata TaxID=81972 RepID=D7LJJ9_ARALL|nr:hypothetical protein ARALYDRAFT_344625 [Arabidopsis lyrata subsp. lyrata]